jgi:hypothetical protein
VFSIGDASLPFNGKSNTDIWKIQFVQDFASRKNERYNKLRLPTEDERGKMPYADEY